MDKEYVNITQEQMDNSEGLLQAVTEFLIALDEPNLLEKARAETLEDEWHKKRRRNK